MRSVALKGLAHDTTLRRRGAKMKKILRPSPGALLLACLLLAAPVLAAEGPHWGYAGAFDPRNWHKADPSFGLCRDGKNQTPVNIRPQYDVALPDLHILYDRKGESVLNNGHTIQVPFPAGNSLTVAGDRAFSLVQVHFHAPGENVLNGRSFLMEGHFVHRDNEGNLLVLAVFYQEGAENPGIASLWKDMPQAAGRTAKLSQPFDPKSILPANLDYAYFNGSLTTPPCSEGVRWCVLKTPLTVSKAQAEALVKVMKGPNNRPLQAINARPVLE
jgi:carbonic anhydrase